MKKLLIAICIGVLPLAGWGSTTLTNAPLSWGNTTGAQASAPSSAGSTDLAIRHEGINNSRGLKGKITFSCTNASKHISSITVYYFYNGASSQTGKHISTYTGSAYNEDYGTTAVNSPTQSDYTVTYPNYNTTPASSTFSDFAVSNIKNVTIYMGPSAGAGNNSYLMTAYSVTLEDDGGGTSYDVTHTLTGVTKTSGDVGTGVASSGSAYNAVFAASAGYALPDDITVTIAGSAATVETDYTWNPSTGAFQVPAAKVTGNIVVTITGCATHTVTASVSGSGGTVSSDKDALCAGKTATITAVPASGYRVSNWAVSGTGSSISPNGSSSSTTTTLTMGSANTTVTVTFEEIPSCTAPALSAPASATVYDDQEKSTTKALAVTVSNSGAMTSLSYQWYSDTNADATGGTALTTSGEIAKGSQGATYSSTTSSEFSTSLYYYCVVTNTCGVGNVASTTSYPFTVTTKDCVSPGLSISLKP